MAAKAKKKVYFPKTRLAELAARAGGLTRDDAIDGAMQSLDSLRGQSDAEIGNSIAAMEAIVFAPGAAGALAESQIVAVQCRADQVVTLAGTFGHAALDAAARSLCDIADGLLRAGLRDRQPIAVHVQTLRLMAPGATTLSAQHSATMLGELSKVTEHFKFGSLGETPVEDDAEMIAATAR